MKPVYLHLENFMNHLDSKIDCSLFNSVLIVGKNKNNDRESNGLGKSTLFNAIEYAIYNAPPSNLNLDDVVHDREKKCKVVFIFEVTKGTFKIIRSRGKKSDVELEELVNKKWVSRSGKTPTITDKTIKNIVGINHKTFKYSVLFAQGDEFGLASVTPETRRGMLKEPLNLNTYGKYEKAAKEFAKEKQQEIEKHNTVIFSLGDAETDVQVTELGLKSTIDAITQINHLIDSTKAAIVQKRSLLSSLEGTISQGGSNVLDKLNNIKHNIRSMQSNTASLNTSIQDAERKKGLTKGGLTADERDLNLLTDIIDSLNDSNLRNESDVKLDLQKIKETELKGIKYIAKLEARQSELKDFLLPDSEDCPYCKQEITNEHREACTTQINKDLEKAESELDIYNPKLINITNKKQDFEKELDAITACQTKLARTKHQIESKKDDINSKYKIIEQLDDILQSHKTLYEQGVAEVNELISQQASLEKMAEEAFKHNGIAKKIMSIKLEIESLESDISTNLNNIALKSSMKGALEEKLRVRQGDRKKINAVKKQIAILEKDLITHKRVIQAFGSTGIPSMIINTILDDLQIEANILLNQIKPELELQFYIEKEKNDGEQAETLEISYRVHGRDRTYYQLSGAQKLVVALSLKLGLSQVIQHRLGVDIKFLALDEVDQSLDEAGVESLMKVIKEWEKKFKIFVITHNATLRHKFKHIIEVVGDMENGVNASLVSV